MVSLLVLELPVKLIEHGKGDLHIPFWKDVLEVNVVLLSVPGHL